MEIYEEAREKALKNLKIADHILTVTYPLIKDPKLLISVIENIFLALTNSMAAILYYEQHYKRVPIFKDDFQTKLSLFREHCIDRLNINKGYLGFMLDIKSIIIAHKKSPVEFVRKDKFIIYSSSNNIKTLSNEKLNEDLQKARSFVYIMNNIVVGKDAGLLRKC